MAKDQGPWGQNDNGSPWGDMDKSPRKAKVIDLPKIKKPGDFDFSVKWIILIVIGLWLASGFYQVQTGEQGVVLRFGSYVKRPKPVYIIICPTRLKPLPK